MPARFLAAAAAVNSLRDKLIENASGAWLTNPKKQVSNSPQFQICSPGLPRLAATCPGLAMRELLRLADDDVLLVAQLGASKIMSLAWREHQRDGIAQGIDERVNFGGQSTARSADRLRAVFFARRRYADERARSWHRSSCIRCRDRLPTA